MWAIGSHWRNSSRKSSLSWHFFLHFRDFLPSLPMKGFTDSCLYIKPLPPQTSCNLFSLLHFYSHEDMIIIIFDSKICYTILIVYSLEFYLIYLCSDLYSLKSYSFQRPISMATSPRHCFPIFLKCTAAFQCYLNPILLFKSLFIDLLLIYVTFCGKFSLLD